MNILNHILINISIIFLTGALVLALWALMRNKRITVKLVVLEVVSNLILAAICVFSVITGHYLYIDICLALALIMFISTVAYVQYLTAKGY